MLPVSQQSIELNAADLNAARAVNETAAIFDVSDRTQIEITGSDRARFLNSFTSNDIKRLKSGEGCETFVTNLKGKVVAHLFVFCHEQSLWLDGTPGQTDAVVNHLKKYLLIEDAQILSRQSDRGELYVTGPLASQILQLEPGLEACHHITRESSTESFDIRRADLLGQPGYLMSIPQSRMELIKRSLTGLGIPEGSTDLYESLRIAAGFPRYGADITDDHLAQEVARTKQCISFDKGCYLGQETIARLDAMGHTNRELRRMQFEGSVVPAAGTSIFDQTGSSEVGIITSATRNAAGLAKGESPSVVALGYLKRAALVQGTMIRLDVEGGTISGHVA